MVTFQLPTVYGLVRTTPVAAEGIRNKERREGRTGKEEGSLERRLGQL